MKLVIEHYYKCWICQYAAWNLPGTLHPRQNWVNATNKCWFYASWTNLTVFDHRICVVCRWSLNITLLDGCISCYRVLMKHWGTRFNGTRCWGTRIRVLKPNIWINFHILGLQSKNKIIIYTAIAWFTHLYNQISIFVNLSATTQPTFKLYKNSPLILLNEMWRSQPTNIDRYGYSEYLTVYKTFFFFCRYLLICFNATVLIEYTMYFSKETTALYCIIIHKHMARTWRIHRLP